MNRALSFFEREEGRLLEELFSLLRLKTISAREEALPALEACAAKLKERLEGLGGEVESWQIPGHPPILFATFKGDSPELPTLLFYNHYDVQPVDPLELWETPPFEPTLREGRIFARGAQDNKGQLFYTLAALASYLEEGIRLPFHLKWLIEGEEESGSEALALLIEEKRERLKADGVLVIDVGMGSLECPALTLGVRGILTLDLIVEGPREDLHSGLAGGIILNPIQRLVEILAKARDAEGRVKIEGFYDGIEALSPEERGRLSFPFDEEALFKLTGVPPEGGELAFPPGERGSIRPTLEINGIQGGYQGEGFKTVLPSVASAKISCRLVPGQKPEEVGALLKRHFEGESTAGAKVSVKLHGKGGMALRCSLDSPLLRVALRAAKESFSQEPALILEGGSIPIAAALAEASGGDLLFLGTGLPSDAIHAPNENFSLKQLKLGCSLIGAFIETFPKEF